MVRSRKNYSRGSGSRHWVNRWVNRLSGIQRKLYPNVDFYSGIIYQAMGFIPDMFTVLFAIPRTVGWLAQWQEMLDDPEQKIVRPRQIYTGQDVREFIPIQDRAAKAAAVSA